MSDAHPETGEWRRLHPLSPLLRGGLVALVIAGIVLANLRDRIIGLFVADEFESADAEGDLIAFILEQGLALAALAVVAAAVALIIFFAWLSWRFHSFRITDEAVESRSGIVFRQHRRAPLDRIQSVNLQRPLLARALGLTEVDVQTAGQGGKVALSYLGYRDAKEVRERILRRAAASRSATPGEALPHGEALPGGAAAPQGSAAPQRVTVSQGAAAPLAPTGLSPELDQRLGDFIDADIDDEAMAAGTLVTVPPGRLIGSVLLGWEFATLAFLSVGAAIAGFAAEPFLLTLLIPFALAAAGIGFRQFNRGWAFTLSRGADAVRVGAGLTATHTETIPFGRIHAVQARQPLLWRPFGWWQVRITTAGHSVSQGGQGAIGNLVLPVGLEADVVRVIETILPAPEASLAPQAIDDPEVDPAPERSAARDAALRDALTGRGAGFVAAGPRSGIVLWFARSRTGLRLDGAGTGTTLRLRTGALTRSLSVIPVVRMQSLLLHRPLLHRALGLATLQTHTVLGPVRTEIRGLELAAARRLFDELAATVVRVQAEEIPTGARARQARLDAAGATTAASTPAAHGPHGPHGGAT